jgi:hypothetical protein
LHGYPEIPGARFIFTLLPQSFTWGARVEETVLHIASPAAEVDVTEKLAPLGEQTQQLKVLDQQPSAHGPRPTLGAQASGREFLEPRESATGLRIDSPNEQLGNSEDDLGTITMGFPAGDG